MRLLILLAASVMSSGCVHSTLGYADEKENGQSVKSYETCMANCLERSEDGQRCVRFSEGMAKVCKEFKS